MKHRIEEIRERMPETPRDHPAYVHDLVCQAIMRQIPFIILVTEEDDPLTINLMSWSELRTVGEQIEEENETHESIFGGEKPIKRHELGTGHDCLVLVTPQGIETELSGNQTRELIDKLEKILGKKPKSAIVIPPISLPKDVIQ